MLLTNSESSQHHAALSAAKSVWNMPSRARLIIGGGAGKRGWMGLNDWKARPGGHLGCWVIGGYDGRALSIMR